MAVQAAESLWRSSLEGARPRRPRRVEVALVRRRSDASENLGWLFGAELPFSEITTTIPLLDVWGEGRVVDGDSISGFATARNINKIGKTITNGPRAGGEIPNLVPVSDYDNPRFPVADGVVEVVTLMGAPITPGVAKEIHRVLRKPSGLVYLYNPLEEDKKVFEANNGGMVPFPHRLAPPFDEPSRKFKPVVIYGFHDELRSRSRPSLRPWRRS